MAHVLIAGNTRLDEVPMTSTAELLLEVATPLSKHAVGLRFYLVIVCHEIWADHRLVRTAISTSSGKRIPVPKRSTITESFSEGSVLFTNVYNF